MHDLDVLGNVPEPLAALLASPDKRVRDGAHNSGLPLWRALGIACDSTGHAEESHAEWSRRAHLKVRTMRRWLARFEAWGLVVVERRGTGTRAGNVATRLLLPGLKDLLLRVAAKLRAKLTDEIAKLTDVFATTARKVMSTPRERVGSDRNKPNEISGSETGASIDASPTRNAANRARPRSGRYRRARNRTRGTGSLGP